MDYTEEIREGLLNLEEGSDFHITRNGGRIELTKEELFKAYEYQQNIFYHDMITEYVKSEAPAYKLLLNAGRLDMNRLVAAVKIEVDKCGITDIEALQNILIPDKTISDAEEIISDFYYNYIAYDSEVTDQAAREYCRAVTADLIINKGLTPAQIKSLSENNYTDNKLTELVNDSLSELSLAGAIEADLQPEEPEL